MIYSRLYHEASISHHGRGISFTDMLLLLAHHKLIVDREALVYVWALSALYQWLTIGQFEGSRQADRDQQAGHRPCQPRSRTVLVEDNHVQTTLPGAQATTASRAVFAAGYVHLSPCATIC